MTNFTEHEKELVAITNDVRSNFSSDLGAVGVIMHPARIEVRKVGQSAYTSELVVDFTSGDDPIDRFEFFVFRNDELIVTAYELRIWLNIQLSEIIESRR